MTLTVSSGIMALAFPNSNMHKTMVIEKQRNREKDPPLHSKQQYLKSKPVKIVYFDIYWTSKKCKIEVIFKFISS